MDAIDGVSYGALPSLGTCWAAPLTTIDWVVQEETEADLQELLGEDYEVYQQGYSSDPGGGGGHADLFDSDSDSEDEAEFLEKEHLDPGLHRFDPFATRTEDDLVTPKKKNLQKKRGRKPGSHPTPHGADEDGDDKRARWVNDPRLSNWWKLMNHDQTSDPTSYEGKRFRCTSNLKDIYQTLPSHLHLPLSTGNSFVFHYLSSRSCVLCARSTP